MSTPTTKVVPDGAWRTIAWPGGEAVAMTIGVALEAWDRQSQVGLAARPGEVDEFSLSYGEYGVRVGVWRLLELFDELGVKVNFSVSGLIAQRHPDLMALIAAQGHDLVGHGWVNDRYMAHGSVEEERAIIRDTLDAVAGATGARPTGWSSPASSRSDRTNEILLDEGIVWSGDDASDDVPFVIDVGGRPLVVLPKANMAANDFIHWVMSHNAPSVFAEQFVDTFDTVHAEGLRGRPGWADIVLHCHMAGRPTFIPTIRRVVEHARAHEHVWWTTKSAMADWALAQGMRR